MGRELVGDREAVRVREQDVQENDIRLKAPRRVDRSGAVLGLAEQP
jgi:hypothetical protein